MRDFKREITLLTVDSTARFGAESKPIARLKAIAVRELAISEPLISQSGVVQPVDCCSGILRQIWKKVLPKCFLIYPKIF